MGRQGAVGSARRRQSVLGGGNIRIGVLDVDGHNWPNLCLMKLSAYHKARGDSVEWHDGRKQYDLVYMSRVFTDSYSRDYEGTIHADAVIKGGTGYGLDNKLPDVVEHMRPDYGLYPQFAGTAYGFLSRGSGMARKRSSCWMLTF